MLKYRLYFCFLSTGQVKLQPKIARSFHINSVDKKTRVFESILFHLKMAWYCQLRHVVSSSCRSQFSSLNSWGERKTTEKQTASQVVNCKKMQHYKSIIRNFCVKNLRFINTNYLGLGFRLRNKWVSPCKIVPDHCRPAATATWPVAVRVAYRRA